MKTKQISDTQLAESCCANENLIAKEKLFQPPAETHDYVARASPEKHVWDVH
jgi:hypothetical protein